MKTTTITLKELQKRAACFHLRDLFEKRYPEGYADYWDVIVDCIVFKEFWYINWVLENIDFKLPEIILNELLKELLNELLGESAFVYPGRVSIKGNTIITGKVFAKDGVHVNGKLTVCGDASIWGGVKADEINIIDDGCIYGGVHSYSLNVSGRGRIEGSAHSYSLNVSGRGCIRGNAYSHLINASDIGTIVGGAYCHSINLSGISCLYGGAYCHSFNTSSNGYVPVNGRE